MKPLLISAVNLMENDLSKNNVVDSDNINDNLNHVKASKNKVVYCGYFMLNNGFSNIILFPTIRDIQVYFLAQKFSGNVYSDLKLDELTDEGCTFVKNGKNKFKIELNNETGFLSYYSVVHQCYPTDSLSFSMQDKYTKFRK